MIINTGNDMHYPVRVVKLMRQNGDSVKLGSVLFEYEYTTLVAKGEDMEEKPTKFYAEFSSEGEGMLKNTFVRRGQTISGPGVPLVEIEEDCTHEVQFGGLCVVCGKDMDEITYMTTVANTERAQINMVHGSKDLKVSAREAGRTSTSAMKRLLREQKLSLVVDLDQTIIHAVCDPTVAEWQKDPLNPNYEAVKDVQSFELMDEGPNARASTYYIKMRPGLRDFLNKMADNYELHIYTMGTRAYAESVAKIIDPTGRLFGDRILSRDESGSMAVKNLSRLFPVDTKMVVIIDDRADVWTWSPNLVRVKAYVFYVGIGDINSSFLPKLEDSAAPVEKPEAVIAVAKVVDEPEDEPEPEANGTSDETASSIDPAEAPSVETASHLQAEAIAAQIQERPLLKLQETLDKADSEEEEARKEHKSEEIQENGAPKPNEPETTTPPSTPPAHRHPLLRNDDDELTFLTKHLSILHDLFFDVYNTNMVMAKDEHEFDEGYEAEDDLELVPDVQDIMPPMKRDVLRGVVICFTGVIPQGINHEHSDIGLWALSFGARVNPELTEQTTHVVADPSRRTSKVRQAAKHPNIFIVDKSWLSECFSKWRRVPEAPYIIEVEPDARPTDVLPIDPLAASSPKSAVDMTDAPAEEGDETNNGEEGEAAGEGEPSGEDSDWEEEFLVNEDDVELDQIDWDELEAEMAEESFSDSDNEDDNDEAEGDNKSNSSSTKSNSSKSGRKRKRKNSDTVSVDSADSSGAEQAAKWKAESDLQRRKKRAFERTTSLTKVQNAADISATTSVKPTAAPAAQTDVQQSLVSITSDVTLVDRHVDDMEEDESDEDERLARIDEALERAVHVATDEIMQAKAELAEADDTSSQTAQNETPQSEV